MRKTNFYSKILTGVCTLVLTAAGLTAVSAQGRYANRYSNRDVGQIIATLESSSNVFRAEFDRSLDRSQLNGTAQEDRINAIVGSYEDSLDRLRQDFDRRNSWWESRNDVQNVMSRAAQVNQMMVDLPFARQLERQWANMRRDLNALADTFDLPGLGGGYMGGGMGGGWQGAGRMSPPPSWAVGTFYSNDGQGIMMTIDRSGRITVVSAGQTYYGRYLRGQMLLNNDVSTITRRGNGIRTYNRNLGQTTDYTRNAYGVGTPGYGTVDPGYDTGYGTGPVSRPPNWAIGTFYSTNGTGISLSIDAGGRVTVINQGQTYYGSYYNGSISLNNDVSTVMRRGRGIRTYNRNTGQTTDYSR